MALRAEPFALGAAAPGGVALPDLKPGEWYEVPNSKLRKVIPPVRPPVGYGNPAAIVGAWSGGAYDTKRDRLIVWGGGHGDYSGNEVYVFDVRRLEWQRLTEPSVPTPPGAPAVNINTDGTPVSRHTYGGLAYLASVDRFWAFGGSRWPDGRADAIAWLFDFETLRWERKADVIPPGRWTELEAVSAYDPVTGHVFMASPSLPLFEYDPLRDAWTQRSREATTYRQVAAIDPVRRQFVAIGRGQMFAFALPPTGSVSRRVLTTRGDTAILHTNYPGFEYEPVSGGLVAWNGGTEVFTFDLETLNWTRRPPASTNTVSPPANPGHGTFGRFRYVPSRNLFILVTGVDSNVFFYRMASGGERAAQRGAAAAPVAAALLQVSLVSPASGQTVGGTITFSASVSDPARVRTVQFRLDGVEIGSEAIRPPYAASWDSTLTSNGAHTASVVVQEASGGVTTATASITVQNPPTHPVPLPSSVPVQGPPRTAMPAEGPRIPLPLRRWVARKAPTHFGGAKHVTGTLNPDNGRLYFVGGDYSYGREYTASYRQETWSLSLAEWFSTPGNGEAGLRLEYPYCGPPGGVQPRGPDFVGWTWDSKRRVFWMVPGTMPGREVCPEPERYLPNTLMTFDPATRKWAAVGTPLPVDHVEKWMGVYDPVTDSLVRFAAGRAEVYDIAKGTWSTWPLGRDGQGRDIQIFGSYLAADSAGRAIYAIDAYSGRLFRYPMDRKKIEDLGTIPGGPMEYEMTFRQPKLVWDSVNGVVLWHRYPDGFFAYHPKTRGWETLSLETDLPGIRAAGNNMAFDVLQNAVVLFGFARVPDLAPPALATSLEAGKRYMFLYRYGNGGGSGEAGVAGAAR